jgi:DNA repair exonuclease SbcCD ATPase subunit
MDTRLIDEIAKQISAEAGAKLKDKIKALNALRDEVKNLTNQLNQFTNRLAEHRRAQEKNESNLQTKSLAGENIDAECLARTTIAENIKVDETQICWLQEKLKDKNTALSRTTNGLSNDYRQCLNASDAKKENLEEYGRALVKAVEIYRDWQKAQKTYADSIGIGIYLDNLKVNESVAVCAYLLENNTRVRELSEFFEGLAGDISSGLNTARQKILNGTKV